MNQTYLQNQGYQATHMIPQTAQAFQSSGQQLPFQGNQQIPFQSYHQPSYPSYLQPQFHAGNPFAVTAGMHTPSQVFQPVQHGYQAQQAMNTAPHQPYHLQNYHGNIMGHDRYLNQDSLIPSQRQYPQAGFGTYQTFPSH